MSVPLVVTGGELDLPYDLIQWFDYDPAVPTAQELSDEIAEEVEQWASSAA